MVGSINGGHVEVTISPDTRGFRQRVQEQLEWMRSMDLKVPVAFDPDTARLDEEMSRMNGKDLRQHVSLDPDMQHLNEVLNRLDANADNHHMRVDADTSQFNRALDQMREDTRRFKAEAQKPADMRVDDSSLKQAIGSLNRMSEKQASLTRRVEHLNAAQQSFKDKLASSTATMSRLSAEGEKGGRRYKNLEQTVHRLNERIRETGREARKAQRQLDGLDGKIGKAQANVRKLSTEWRHAVDSVSGQKFNLDTPFQQSFARDLALKAEQQSHALDEEKRKADELSQAFRKVADSQGHVSLAAAQAREAMQHDSREQQESVRALKEQIENLTGSMHRLQATHPLGVGNNEAFRSATRQIHEATEALDTLSRHGRVDMDSLERSYANANSKLAEYSRRIREADNKRIQLEFVEKNYDHVTALIDRLEHQRINIPVELHTELKNIQSRWAELREKALDGKDISLDVDLDLKTHKAKEEMKRFERKNNELKMDVDLETALARVHLAEFTRPRTINIFAKFHQTDLGKIAYGATYGATGIGAVNDRFQRLVELFDKIDKRVPKYTTFANVLTAVGAGVTNLTQATFGLGAGIINMSKAALAAPSLLLGLGAVAGGVAETVNYYLDDFKDALSTIEKGIDVGAVPAVRRGIQELTNQVAPAVARSMRVMGAASGKFFTDFIEATNKAVNGDIKTLPTIINNASRALIVLSPGIASLWDSLLRLSSDTSGYLPKMAGWVNGIADSWARWIRNAEATGKIDAAVQEAVRQGHLLKESFGDAISTVTGLWHALNPKSQGLEGFENVLGRMERAVNSAKFQEVMGAWSAASQRASHEIMASFKSVSDHASEMKQPFADLIESSGTIVSSIISQGSRLIGSISPNLDRLVRGTSSGLQKIVSGIADASPAIGDIVDMIGNMADTFGGTFAATLRATAPMISAIAQGASAVAKAFASLPEPIQAAIGMYATWGRAGVRAIDSLKQGILENITQVLRYRSTLSGLGIEVNNLGRMSFPTLIRALHAAKTGNDAAGIQALSEGLSNVSRQASSVSGTVSEAGSHIAGMGRHAQDAATAGAALGSAIESSGGKVGVFKSAISGAKNMLNGFIDLAGGWTGIALTAAFMGVSAAADDVQRSAQNAEKAINGMHDAMNRAVPVGSSGQKMFNDAFNKELSNQDIVGGPFGNNNNWANRLSRWINGNQFDNAKSALKTLGMSVSDVEGKFAKGSKGVSDFKKELSDIQYKNMVANPDGTAAMDKTAQAAHILYESVDSLNAAYKKGRQGIVDYMNSTQSMTDLANRAQSEFSQLGTTIRANGGNINNTDTQRAIRDAAADAIANANAIQANVKAYGGQRQATQAAKNAIQEYRDSLVSTLEQQGWSEDAANKLADSLGLQASRWNNLAGVTRDTADAYMRLAPITDDVKNRINHAIDNGAITQWKDFQSVLADLTKDPTKTITVTADGHAVALTADQLKGLQAKIDDKGRWTVKFDAKDLASPKFEKMAENWSKSKLDVNNFKAIIDADISKADGKFVKVKTAAKALGLTPAEIKVVAKGADMTKQQLSDIKKTLTGKGFDDKQVKVILRLFGYNEAGKQIGELDKKGKKPITKPVKADTRQADSQIKKTDDNAKKPATKPVKADTSKADGQIKKTNDKAEKPATKHVDANTNQANKKIDKTNQKASKSATKSIDADLQKANAKIKDLNKQIQSLTKKNSDLKIKVQTDSKKATAQIRDLNKQIDGITKKTKKGVTIKAQAKFGNTDKQVAKLGKDLDALNKKKRDIKIRVTADSKGVSAQINRINKEIGSLSKRKAHVTVTANAGGAVSAATSARRAINAIPSHKNTVLTTSGGPASVSWANRVRTAVNNIARSHMTRIMQSGASQTAAAARNVREAISRIQRSHTTSISAHIDWGSLSVAQSAIDNFVARNADRYITIHTRHVDDGGGQRHALGGRVSGPGTETSDSIPAMLSRNEMVINAASVHKLDAKYPGLLDRMNQVGDVADLIPERPIRLAAGTVRVNEQSLRSLDRGFDDSAAVAIARDLHALREELPAVIARNSSPWPSKSDFARDVRRASLDRAYRGRGIR